MDRSILAGMAQLLSSTVKVGYIACLFLGLSISPPVLLICLAVLGAAELCLFLVRVLALHCYIKKWDGIKGQLCSFIALFPSALFIVGIYLNIPLLVAIGVGLACLANFFGLIFLVVRGIDCLLKYDTIGNRLFLGIVTIIMFLVSVPLYGVSIAAIFHIAPLSFPLAIVCLTLLGIGTFIRTLNGFAEYWMLSSEDAISGKLYFYPETLSSAAFPLYFTECCALKLLEHVNIGPEMKF